MFNNTVVAFLLCVLTSGSVRAEGERFISSVPGEMPPQHVRLAEAIIRGDLADAMAAAEGLDLRFSDGFHAFLLSSGSRANQHVIWYFRDHYQLRLSDLEIFVMSGDCSGVADLLLRNVDSMWTPEPPPLRPTPRDMVSLSRYSLLRLAIDRNDAKMVKLLLEEGARPYYSKVPIQAKWFNDKPHPLINSIARGNPEIVKLLIDAGAQLQESTFIYVGRDRGWRPDTDKATASTEVILKEYEEAVAAGKVVKVNVPSANEFGPMATAIRAGRAQIVELLLQAGADPNVSIGGKTTPLHLAVESGHPGIVKLLIDAGADINKPNAQGHTPLGVGYYKGDIADMLMAVGAKLKLKADQGAAEPQQAEPAKPAPESDPTVDVFRMP